MVMFIVGILIHVTFLFSIFDIYFKSPVVKNVIPYEPLHEAISQRLVLFVVDGLRAESFLNYTTMPYLRSIANTHGRWGISHTRVPTESRPGHVAIIAGFYEDPSAVAKGWKENPVDFDSVFNRTAYTWCWGTYDIVDIFTKGTVTDHIFVNKFDPYDQTFSSDKNTTALDGWVFDNVKLFFDKAKKDADIKRKLQSEKVVLFLHLLGTDTAGHTHKPKTLNFLTTIRHVDENIKQIERVISNFYNDDSKTTFLMSSDHGMTDWGSHGTGDNHETQTPYVLWGNGVQQVHGINVDPETEGMSLEHRYDIQQADLAPLMSTFLSVPVPVNSVGRVPIDLLNITLENKAKALYSNSRQLLSQYNKKKIDIEENSITMFYKPYEPLDTNKLNDVIILSEQLLKEQKYEELITLSEDVTHMSLIGLTYYHNYYQYPLLFAITLSFCGWIAFLFLILLKQTSSAHAELSDATKSHKTNQLYKVINIISLFLLLVTSFLVYAQNLPLSFHIYFSMPNFLWTKVLLSSHKWTMILKKLKHDRSLLAISFEVMCYVLGSFAMGLSFTYRWMLSIPLLGMGLWPMFSSSAHHLSNKLMFLWMTGCFSLSIFSFIPVVGKEVFIELVIIAGIIWIIVMVTYLWLMVPLKTKNASYNKESMMIISQGLILSLSLYIIYVQAKQFESSLALSTVYQSICWIFSGVLTLLPFAYSRDFSSRLIAINTSIVNFYLLLAVSHEGLFMIALIFNITCWMIIEFQLLNLGDISQITAYAFGKEKEDSLETLTSIERGLTSNDFRRAFFFTAYIILAFFGTGNIASLNSFEVRWVINFTTSYKPFLITALVLLKTLAPFLCVGCTFRAVQHFTKAPAGYLNIIVLIYSSLMGIQLLYYVKNTGSWLEIGTSISQFVIVQVITLFIVIINQISRVLTEADIYNLANKLLRNKKKYV